MDRSTENGFPKPLHSDFEDDPDLRDLVILFVDELHDRIREILGAWSRGDSRELQRISHQLKGAAGGYGFAPIGDAAARLEHDLLREEEVDSSTLSERVDDLVSNCRAAVPPSAA